MAIKTIMDSTLTAIADAIRAKTGKSASMTPLEMPTEIGSISGGGGMDAGLEALLNGTAAGSITIPGVEDLSAARIITSNAYNYEINKDLTELHMPDLIRWTPATAATTSLGKRHGGLIDSGSSSNLEVLDIPKCERLYISNHSDSGNINTFQKLETLNAPKLKKLTGALRGCGLTEIRTPVLNTCDLNFFVCTSLKIADLGIVSACPQFGSSSSLEALVLRKNDGTLVTLGGTAYFSGTPIASGTGYIYVPRDLVDSYKAASNWSTYATQFRAIEDYTVNGEFVAPSV